MKPLKSAGCFQPSPALFQVLNSRIRPVATKWTVSPCCNHSAKVILSTFPEALKIMFWEVFFSIKEPFGVSPPFLTSRSHCCVSWGLHGQDTTLICSQGDMKTENCWAAEGGYETLPNPTALQALRLHTHYLSPSHSAWEEGRGSTVSSHSTDEETDTENTDLVQGPPIWPGQPRAEHSRHQKVCKGF